LALAHAALVITQAKSQPAILLREAGGRRSAKQISARQPLFWGAFAFSAGIFAGRHLWRPESWWTVSAVVFLLSALCLPKRRIIAGRFLVLGAMFCAGALSFQLRSAAVPSETWLPDAEASITAHVVSEGNIEAQGAREFRQRIDVETDSVSAGGLTRNIAERVRLSVYQTTGSLPGTAQTQMKLLGYGQVIRFRGSLIAPRNYRNPGAFDYAGYLRDSGIAALSSTKWSEVQVLPGFSGTRVELWRSRIHRSIIEKIHQLWPKEIAGLMDAIVIGEEIFIDRSTRVDFQRSGTYHVLVVSGMNVSILAMFALWMLRRVGLRDIAASMLAIGVVLAYAVLTREGSPVWRAALMFAIYLCTRLLYRDRAMLNALGLAALLLLVADPRQLFGASFQMTFLCVALVAGIGIPVLERTIQPYSHGLRNLSALSYDRALPPKVAQFRLDMRMILSRLALIWPGRLPQIIVIAGARFAFGLFELAAMSAILQFGLALPMAYYFHRATSMAMPANLFVIPFLELLMPTAVLAICISYICLPIAKLPAMVAGVALQGIAGTVKWLGGMRLADIRVPTPGVSAIIFSALAIGSCSVLARKRPWLAMAGISLLAVSALWIWLIPPRENVRHNVLEMTAIDVGQGDSIFLVTPQGRKLLVDARRPAFLDALAARHRRRRGLPILVVARNLASGRGSADSRARRPYGWNVCRTF
jgi:competence protein ComEC